MLKEMEFSDEDFAGPEVARFKYYYYVFVCFPSEKPDICIQQLCMLAIPTN